MVYRRIPLSRGQQYAALMHDNGYLDVPDADQADVARHIAAHLRESG